MTEKVGTVAHDRGWRSLLFVPGDNDRLLEKAVTSAADTIVIDLEDGVAAEHKAAARTGVRRWAARLAKSGKSVVVRINGSWRAAVDDLEQAVSGDVAGIMIPKAQDANRLAILHEIISEFEQIAALPAASIALVPLIETAAAMHHLDTIAAAPRVIGLALGSEDFCADLGLVPTIDALDLPCRLLAIAAAARRIMSLAVPVSIAAFGDLETLDTAARLAKRFGSTGALCIHPAQVDVVNRVFSPDPRQIALARAMLDAWLAAQAQGVAVVVVDGHMVDAPVAARAKRLIQIAGIGSQR